MRSHVLHSLSIKSDIRLVALHAFSSCACRSVVPPHTLVPHSPRLVKNNHICGPRNAPLGHDNALTGTHETLGVPGMCLAALFGMRFWYNLCDLIRAYPFWL
jgi:hypothetical protein